ncbi:MAG TPA: penicillin-binding protein [Streptosporangiaceae bacterium]|nr:penicillin-binding protein [Streptosporangiaceae bacterium]
MSYKGRSSKRSFQAVKAIGGLAGAGVFAGLLAALMVLPLACTAGVGARDSAEWFQSMPSDLRTPPLPQRSRLLAADGSLLATFYFENRVEVRLDQVAPAARQAILAIEDSRFYEHGALDAKGTVRALVQNMRSGEVTQGGSGLTQQYVKNVLFESAETEEQRKAALEVSPARKVRELRYAMALEKMLPKDEILRRYLNIAYFGDGAYGIEAAARRYFGKPAARVTLAEAATLAGVVRYPFAYNPRLHPGAAKERRNTVLDRMVDLGWVPAAEARAAARQPLGLDLHDTPNGCVTSKAPYFCDYVQREILANPVFGATAQQRLRLLQRGGLTIRTTLDWQAQRAAQRAVNRHVPPRNDAHKAAAEALVEPGTGEIKGMVVDRKLGPDKERGKTWINFAADSSHGTSVGMQSGSTFKVFTLAAALSEGMPFGERLMAPREYTTTGMRDCDGNRVSITKPLRNSGDGEGGRTFSLLTGTHHSVNTFFLALEKKVGLCDTVKMAERLGMRRADGSPLRPVGSLTLGSNEVSPVRMAAAYAAFGARGRYCSPIAIKSITDANGASLRVPSADCHQAIRKGVADAVSYVLRGVLTEGTGAGLGIGRPAAAKTGTVDNFSAAWFAGYTPDLAAAVWVGDPRGGYAHPMDSLCMDGRCYGPVYGAVIPGPIWRDTMIAALRDVPAHGFARPPSQYFRKGSGEDSERVPDVRGLSVSAAMSKLRDAGLDAEVSPETVPSDRYRAGTVAMTSPEPGAEVDAGSSVTLYLSSGRPEPPEPPFTEPPFTEPPFDPPPGRFPSPTPTFLRQGNGQP